MKNSTAILATIALGAALATGSATASMARGGMSGHGGGMSDHGGSMGGGHTGGIPSIMNQGNGSDGGRSVGGSRAFDHGRHFGGFRGRDDANAFFGSGPFCSYGPASGTYTGRYGRHYCS